MNQSIGNKETAAEEKSPEILSCISAKIIQYLMLAMLLVLVFAVSAYAGITRMKQKGQNPGGLPGGTGGTENVTEDTGISNETKGGAETEAVKGTIVLDAGHGGMDPGVSGAGGVMEQELNLIFAKKLERLLTDEGYRVVQTRTTEAGLYDEGQTRKKAQDMQRRCAIIEKEQPLLTVSIHQNSYPDASVRGPQVFYYKQSAEGERLASCIQERMNAQLEAPEPKKVKGNDTYYILKRSVSTTVIVECGFLTNADEAALLQQEEYQNRAAQAICAGILDYLAASEA